LRLEPNDFVALGLGRADAALELSTRFGFIDVMDIGLRDNTKIGELRPDRFGDIAR